MNRTNSGNSSRKNVRITVYISSNLSLKQYIENISAEVSYVILDVQHRESVQSLVVTLPPKTSGGQC